MNVADQNTHHSHHESKKRNQIKSNWKISTIHNNLEHPVFGHHFQQKGEQYDHLQTAVAVEPPLLVKPSPTMAEDVSTPSVCCSLYDVHWT